MNDDLAIAAYFIPYARNYEKILVSKPPAASSTFAKMMISA